MSRKTKPLVACPQCGRELEWDPNNRYRPFCSERCKLIDLGKWAHEEYRIEQRERDSGDQEESQA